MNTPVRLLILSDLHLEFSSFITPDPALFDIAILAGDIGVGVKPVRWALRPSTFGGKPVIYVAGNHEFYGSERKRVIELLREAAAGSNVHVLERDEVVVHGVRFLGTTMWTNFELDVATGTDVAQAMSDAIRSMNDFRGAIRERRTGDGQRRLFTPQDAAREHALSRTWLLERLQIGSALPMVVVTHHAPSPLSMDPIYEGSELNPCYYSRLEASFFERAALWVHGHSHSSSDYVHKRTRVIANPRGYVQRGRIENPGFDPQLVINLGADHA